MISEKEINKMINNIKTSLQIEGMDITNEETKIGKKFLKGEISENEALKLILGK